MKNSTRNFDGVICFGGEDWWYHNRGHFDMRIMQQLANHLPVMFVNSLGMRVPKVREGGMFLRRLGRKFASLRRGLVKVQPNFHVFTPAYLPGRIGSVIKDALLAAQVRRMAKSLGIKRPLVWVACPTAQSVLPYLNFSGLVFQRTDRFESFTSVDSCYIGRLCASLLANADLTVFCAPTLFESESNRCKQAAFIDHGVAFDKFACVASAPRTPPGLRGINRPRVGFVGGLDEHTFDLAFFQAVAANLPHFEFVLVGSSSFPDDSFALPNVTRVGQVEPEVVPAYLHACDVLIMPWCQNEWIRACNPVKLKEYLATGKPIVSTPFPALEPYRDLVRVASCPEEFAWLIRAARLTGNDATACRERVRDETWSAKGHQVLEALRRVGLVPDQGLIEAEFPQHGSGACPV